MFETPILFIIFNRPEVAGRVFEKIRVVRPSRLFIAADGPRASHPGDEEGCRQTREQILQLIDWPCDVKTLFQTENKGCGKAPAAAITWFFDHVEEGIILEDDCLPSDSFFLFCRAMLARYRDDPRMIAISGYNFAGTWFSDRCDYFFSDGGNWGWAAWKRSWKLFDYDLKSWPSLPAEKKQWVEAYYPDFDRMYQKLISGQTDVWDLQWHYTRLVTQGLSITPAKNLIQNIGFGPLATHTFEPSDYFGNIQKYEIKVSDTLRPKLPEAMDMEYRKKIFELTARASKEKPLQVIKRWTKKLSGL